MGHQLPSVAPPHLPSPHSTDPQPVHDAWSRLERARNGVPILGAARYVYQAMADAYLTWPESSAPHRTGLYLQRALDLSDAAAQPEMRRPL